MKKIFVLLISLFVLCACASAPSQDNSANNKQGSFTPSENAASEDELIAQKVSETKAEALRKTLQKKDYNNIFTANIPEGWQVTTGGTDWYIWIRIYDPASPETQVMTNISTTAILKSERAKEFYKWAYDISKDDYLYGSTKEMVVNESGTMEEYFKDYMEYINWIAQYDPSFQGFDFPLIEDFEKIEDWDVDDNFSSISIDNKLIHAQYTEGLSKNKGEGLFNGCFTNGLVMMDPGYDCGFYTLYNVNFISAPYGMFAEYEEVLREILGSIEYTEAFLTTAASNQKLTYAAAMQVNEIMRQTSQIIVDGWNQRQASYDRISQAYSDATLGYDRYYDTETGEVYRVEYGVMDGYNGDRYQLIQNDSDLYSLPVSGYIYK